MRGSAVWRRLFGLWTASCSDSYVSELAVSEARDHLADVIEQARRSGVRDASRTSRGSHRCRRRLRQDGRGGRGRCRSTRTGGGSARKRLRAVGRSQGGSRTGVSRYRVEVGRRALKSIAALRRRDQQRIRAVIELLADEPRPPGCAGMVGEAHAYRVRTGDYRIVYEVFDDSLLVQVVRPPLASARPGRTSSPADNPMGESAARALSPHRRHRGPRLPMESWFCESLPWHPQGRACTSGRSPSVAPTVGRSRGSGGCWRPAE